MTLLHKRIHLIAVLVTIAVSLSACTEKAADNNQSNPSKTLIPPVVTVTEDRIAQLQREAQEGDSDAQYNLAYLYENGLGVPKDESKALELYEQAADQGHPSAKNNIDTLKNTPK